MFRTITNAEPCGAYRVRLTYAGGEQFEIDFAKVVEKGGVFTPLSNPSFFSQVFVGNNGRALCWPDEIEFCADALWLQAHDQHVTSYLADSTAKLGCDGIIDGIIAT